jgi:dihydroflavonol-4-reductase
VVAFHRPASRLALLDGLPVEHALGDLTRPETLAAAMRGVDAVFHVAAQLGDSTDPQRFYAVTVAGTRAVLEAAQAAGADRLVHTSSVAALGVPEQPGLMDENHTWNYPAGLWHYGYAKYLAELEVQKAVAAGLDAVIVNPSLVFGPGDLYRVSSSIVTRMARRPLPVSAPGGVNVVHVNDVVAGHLPALERGATGERYILGGENLSIADFLSAIAAVTGVTAPGMTLPGWLVRLVAGVLRRRLPFSLPVSGEILAMAGRNFYYDTAKSRRELKLPAPIPAIDALADAWQWFSAQAGV